MISMLNFTGIYSNTVIKQVAGHVICGWEISGWTRWNSSKNLTLDPYRADQVKQAGCPSQAARSRIEFKQRQPYLDVKSGE